MFTKQTTRKDAVLFVVCIFMALAIGAVFSGCTQPTVKTQQPPEKVKDYPLTGWDERYNDMIYSLAFKYKIVDQPAEKMNFCERWDKLSAAERGREVANLFHGVAVYESGIKLTDRMVETSMGIDKKTGAQVASEGLLQLSYQDGLNHEACKAFDYSKDKLLKVDDPNRTIFKPENQFNCGIYIASVLLKRNELSVGVGRTGLGRYWHVLRVDTKWPKIQTKMKEYESKCFNDSIK